VATLNGSGQISTVVLCTDSANVTGFTYTIGVAVNGAATASYPAKTISHSLGSTVDLTALLP